MQKKEIIKEITALRAFHEVPISEMTEKDIKKYLKERFPSTPQKIQKSLTDKIIGESIKFNWNAHKIRTIEVMTPASEALCQFMQLDRATRRMLVRKGAVFKDKNGVIILSINVTVVKTLIAVMKLKGSKADIAKQVVDSINTAKTSQYVSITTADIDEALGLAADYLNSDSSTEKETERLMKNAMTTIMGQFQNYANDNPKISRDVIASGGFTVKKITPRKKQEWSAKNNEEVQGTIDLQAPGGGPYTCHLWWISYDGVTFERMDPTIAANMQVKGFAGGIDLFFQHQLITKKGPQEKSNVIRVTVLR
jgi:hypothetical protein